MKEIILDEYNEENIQEFTNEYVTLRKQIYELHVKLAEITYNLNELEKQIKNKKNKHNNE